MLTNPLTVYYSIFYTMWQHFTANIKLQALILDTVGGQMQIKRLENSIFHEQRQLDPSWYVRVADIVHWQRMWL